MPKVPRSADAARRAPPSARTAADVEQVLREVQQFYLVGTRLQKELPEARFRQLQEKGGSVSAAVKLRNAWIFAKTYTERDFDELCDACRRGGFALGTSVLTRLLVVPMHKRKEFQRRAIEGKWSMLRLNVEIRRQFGTTKPWAGKRIHLRDTADALYRLTETCRRWSSLHEALAEWDSNPNSKARLPRKIWDRVREAQAAISSLQGVVEEELDRETGNRRQS